ncbi:M1 family metallopeptidase [Planotetraspora sp. A-T 1434]|uniref:M1 family metallopeptidase n=1 Tax=Planotetraspora sp. A-T 1434 TaxID=2979219 RepID=UPI0021C1849B|nr:M1 family metallopeptidase [Planotetraspora sp. A-T 1434]MCT9931625.1 M1 family metallopeptidase [Planotetraspora sp. A-T 1434]
MAAHRFATTLSLTTALSLGAPFLGLATACTASEGAVAAETVPGGVKAPPAGDTVGAPGVGDPDFPQDGNGGYDVDHYGLKLSYDPASKRLEGSAAIRARAVQDLTAFDLDLHGLTVSRVTVDGAAAQFGRREDELTVTAPARIKNGTRFDVTVDYAGVPDPVRNYAGLGTYGFIATTDGSFVTCEPNGAKTWFPSNDHPSDKATYDFKITVPEGLTAIANGEMDAQPKTSDGKTTFAWREKHPMATYLATMTTGKFEVRTGTSDLGIPVYAAVDPAFHGSLDNLYTASAKITDYWTTVFGPYPFSSTGGVVDNYSAGYALENQTKPVYGGFTPDTGIIAHELAHQWFGDSVSITRWKDLWLNEGFATYAEWLWSEHRGGQTADALFRSYYANNLDPIWSYPPGRAQRADLFNGSVYTRGAMTLHALRKEIGDATFFALLKKWTAAHRYGNATTEEFVALAEHMSGKKLDGLFDAWLYQPRRPAPVT